MATWEIDITGLQILKEDDSGWPVTRVVSLTMRIEEDSVARLHKTARKEAEDQFPGYYDYAFNGILRLGKRTNKDYGFGREDARPAYRLSSSQQKELRRIKGEIFHKFVGDELLRNPLALLGRDASVNRPGGDVAWLSDQSGIFTHEEAEKVIKALQRLYSRISREELSVLRMHDGALSHDDLEVIRSYRGASPAAA